MKDYTLQQDWRAELSRRSFLRQSAYGLGGIALGCLMGSEARAQEAPQPVGPWTGVIKNPPFRVRARRIIHLCMAGGASHLETLDNKPMLRKLNGQPMPASLTAGQQLAQLQNMELKVLGCKAEFKKFGQSAFQHSGIRSLEFT